MIHRPVSTVGQVSILILAVIVVVEIICFALVLWIPTPEQPRYSIRSASLALASHRQGITGSFSTGIVPVPTGGRDAAVVEQVLALLLNEDPANVRASWSDTSTIGIPFTIMAGNGGRSVPPKALLLLSDLPLPAFSAAIRRPDGRWQVASPNQSGLAIWQFQMLLAFGLSTIVLVPIAIIVARRLALPFQLLEQFASDDASRSPPHDHLAGPREVRTAFGAILLMRERLAQRAGKRIHILAAVAHDLRTPLTGLRLRIEDATEPGRTRMIEDVGRMERMISDMLAYARDDHARSSPCRIDVHAEIARIASSFAPSHVVITHHDSEPLDLWVDPQDFDRAVLNLVQNAVTYGSVASIEVIADADRIAIMVHDEGTGIPASERERIVLPFERGEGSRNRHTGGVGLGLSSALSIASKYGGNIQFRDRHGGGFTVSITFSRHMYGD
jgi:signal transduction histidine kinase